MTLQNVTEKILGELNSLAPEQQHEVLAFTRSLSQPKGAKGSSLLSFAGSIPSAELTQMQATIEEGCGRIDLFSIGMI